MNEPLAYYNEHDKFAAAWLRNLIAAGHIAPGDVDERDIRDVTPPDLRGYRQCHFFAGIGVWSHALRRAGWPDRRPVWTASCPCQPFSQAGKGGGLDDERHLWPAFFHLVEQCGPRELFGEQVASKDGLAWLDLVQSDMEGAGYAFGALDICAAGFGAPHIRQRLYWMAHAERRDSEQSARSWAGPGDAQSWRSSGELAGRRDVGFMAYDDSSGRPSRGERCATVGHGPVARPDCSAGRVAYTAPGRRREFGSALERNRREAVRHTDGGINASSSVAYADGGNAGAEREQRSGQQRQQPTHGGPGHNQPTGPINGVWRNADWLLCRDGKWRPVRSGSFPLAHGAPARVGRLRAYGNAIVAPQAEEFIAAYLEIEHLRLSLTSGVFA